MEIELTVLGSAGSHPQAGRVCSGYLVEADGTKLLLDAGNGSTANLQRFVGFGDLDAVLVSHRHVDHCIDLIGGYYAMRFDPQRNHRLPLYGPAEVAETLRGLLSSDAPFAFDEIYDTHEVAAGDHLTFGAVSVELFHSVHPPPAVSMRLTVGDSVLVYSGDTAGGDDLIACARDADLLLCEASWAGDPADYPPGIHLTGRQAGEVAARAGVKQLVLTHVAGGTDRAAVLTEAREAFDGPVELAEDLARYRIG